MLSGCKHVTKSKSGLVGLELPYFPMKEIAMRRFLLIAAAMGSMTLAGASAVKAGAPVQVVDWDHHHHVVVDRFYPPVRYVRPEVVYYPPVVTAPIVAAPPVVVAPPVVSPPVVVAPPAGFVSIGGRHFGIRFGF
jgi:hypothetical protein